MAMVQKKSAPMDIAMASCHVTLPTKTDLNLDVEVAQEKRRVMLPMQSLEKVPALESKLLVVLVVAFCFFVVCCDGHACIFVSSA